MYIINIKYSYFKDFFITDVIPTDMLKYNFFIARIQSVFLKKG